MTAFNPYVATLIEMGYDEQDCRNVAAAGLDATYPRTIHGRTFQTKAEYDGTGRLPQRNLRGLPPDLLQYYQFQSNPPR